MDTDVFAAAQADPPAHRLLPLAALRLPLPATLLAALRLPLLAALRLPLLVALRLPLTAALLAALALGGCVEQAYKDSIAQFPPPYGSSSESGSSTQGEETPTTGEEGPPYDTEVQTLTGEETSTTDSTTTGVDDNPPPTIEKFVVVPKHLGEAGPAELQLVASADVVTVLLTLDAKKLDEFTLADFPRLWEALSAKDNGPARTFEVVVADEQGLTASAEATLSVLLPQAGVEKCIFSDLDKATVSSMITALEYTSEAIYAVGSRDTGMGLRLTAWKLDPNGCDLEPGWPKSMVNWSDDPALQQLVSVGSAVDVDGDGNVVIGGNFVGAGGVPRSYVALLNAQGSRLWEKAGKTGDEVMGVAAANGQFKGRVFVAGARRTKDVPVVTDGAVWIYQANADQVSVGGPTIVRAPLVAGEDPDVKDERSERIRAVVVHPDTGNALAVGEREFLDAEDNLFNRAFAVQVEPLVGDVVTAWTSGAPALLHDAMRSVGVCGERFVAGGWTRDLDPNAKPQPMLYWIESDGSSFEFRHFPQLGSAQIHGVACDRELKVVSAGQRLSGGSDAQVFNVEDPFAPPVWYEKGVVGDDTAAAVDCDPRGFCGWGGFRASAGKPFAVVRVHHP